MPGTGGAAAPAAGACCLTDDESPATAPEAASTLGDPLAGIFIRRPVVTTEGPALPRLPGAASAPSALSIPAPLLLLPTGEVQPLVLDGGGYRPLARSRSSCGSRDCFMLLAADLATAAGAAPAAPAAPRSSFDDQPAAAWGPGGSDAAAAPPAAKKRGPSQVFRQRQKGLINDLERQVRDSDHL